MMRSLVFVAALLATPANLAAQEAVEGDPVMTVRQTDERMNEATNKARETSAQWLAILADPPVGTETITFKFPLEGYEHIWVGEVQRDGDYLTGKLQNNPHSEGWRLGDSVRVPIAEISDWGYVDPVGRAHGFYTVRVMLEHMAPEDAASVREAYGWDD